MTQVNLLPPEILQRQRTKRRAMLVIAGGGAALLLVFLFYLLQVNNLSNVHGQIAAQEAKNARLQTEVENLQQYADLQAEADAKQQTLTVALAYEASFSGMLRDLSIKMPADAYLTSMAITITPAEPSTTATGATGTALVGQISFGGTGLGANSVVEMINGLESVRGWVNPFVTTVAREQAGSQVATFDGTVDLDQSVLTKQGKQGAAIVSGATP